MAGQEYDTEDETAAATILPGSPRTLTTDYALGIQGGSATFKVYVTTTTGHERGSNAVTVTMPG